MTDRFSFPSWSARNPLGIIALFISLIYGMSALLLGTSVKNLTDANQTLLVAFIAGFPFVVLSVFGWLVARHHQKLYGPGDYRSDEGFLNVASALPPQALGQRLREEVEQADQKISAPSLEERKFVKQLDAGVATDHNLSQQSDTQQSDEKADPVLRAYAAENLVFQELQNELGGALRKNVSIELPNRRYQLDALLASKEKTIFIEVKQLFARTSISVVIQKARMQFADLSEHFRDRPNFHFLLAIVTNFAITDSNREKIKAEVEQAQSSLGERFEIRFYSFADLVNKYGLSRKPQTRLGQI